MDVVILLVFVSLALATLGVFGFLRSTRDHADSHAARLALLPLETDSSPPPSTRPDA